MSSSQATPSAKLRLINFSSLFHVASLILLIACVFCIAVLFRDMRRLKVLVQTCPSEIENWDENNLKIRARRSPEDGSRVYKTDLENDRSKGRVNFGDSKLTIVTKDDEKLLLQTADGSPWALLPSMTRISLSTLEDFCLTTQQYCTTKSQAARPRNDKLGADCDGRCSNRRSNNDTPGDAGATQSVQTESNNFATDQFTGEQYDQENSGTSQLAGKSNEIYSNHVSGQSTFGRMTPSSQNPATSSNRRKGLGRKKRKRERCFIEKIGKPILVGQRKTFFGSWMQDSSPREDLDVDKRWVTEHVYHQFLLEYATSHDLRYSGSHSDTPVTPHQLPFMYYGTNHLMYNGSFLYQRAGFPVIIRYDLRTGNWTGTEIVGAACNGGDVLYNVSSESNNYFDIAADENGIWVFFHYEKSKILSVARLHPKTMRIINVRNLTRFDHKQLGDTWVACGVMYVLQSTSDSTSRVSMAYDLFRHRSAIVNLPWRNTYNKTSMLSYNPLAKKLHIFDNGYLLERNLIMAYPGKQG